jgi:hypothetical protein
VPRHRADSADRRRRLRTGDGDLALRTDKSGRHRYDTWATDAQKRTSALPRQSIPMDKLDTLVPGRFSDRLLIPGRVEALLRGLVPRQSNRDADDASCVTALRAKIDDAEGRLGRHYQAIGNGIADLAVPTLNAQLAAVKQERDGV